MSYVILNLTLIDYMFLENHVFSCLLLCITPTFSSLKNYTHLLSHNVIVSGIQVQLNWVFLLSISQKAAKCQLGLHHLNVELGEDLLLRSLSCGRTQFLLGCWTGDPQYIACFWPENALHYSNMGFSIG